jgi:hypothetical protein
MDDPAYLAMRSMEEDPGEGEDPDDAPPPDVDQAELAAEAAEVLAAQERLAAVTGRLGLIAALAAGTAEGWGRRGPGMPGSTGPFPGVYASRASGFGSGKPLDTAPGCLVLGQFAEEAAGEDDRYPGAGDDELAGAVAAWDRVEAYASSRKHAAVAELIRRRPAEGCTPQGPAQMPEALDEFTPREVASVLGRPARCGSARCKGHSGHSGECPASYSWSAAPVLELLGQLGHLLGGCGAGLTRGPRPPGRARAGRRGRTRPCPR